MSEVPVRRQVRRQVLRVQSRLESGTSDRWFPAALAVGLASVFAGLSLSRYRSLDAGADLAGYTQALHLITEGLRPEASLLGPEIHLLELHWSFVLYPLAGLAFLAPAAEVLLVAQSALLGLAVVPLWALARNVAHLRFGASLAVVLAYALHPGIHALAVNDFHPEAMAVPGLLGLAYFGARRRWVAYWLCVAFVLACRADLGITVALWGFVLLGEGERRTGLWTLGIGTLWSLGLLLVLQPLVSGGARGQYGEYGDSLGAFFVTALGHPVGFFQDLTARPNVTLLVSLLAPLIFLPLLSLKHLLPALPLGAVYLITDFGDTPFAERTSMLLAFVFIAGVFALRRLGTQGVDRVFVDGRLQATLVVAALLAFVDVSPVSPYEQPWRWPVADPADDAVREAIAHIEPDDAVRGSRSALAAIAERPWIHELNPDEQPQVAFAVFRVRAVLVDERHLPALDEDERLDQRRSFTEAMAQQGYVLRFDDPANGVFLYYRP